MRHVAATSFLVVLAVVFGFGCAGSKKIKPPVENVTPERTKRQQKLNDNFNQQHELAQYQSALQSWHGGDPSSCREMLTSLLKLNPKHKEGRQLLADLHLDDGDLQSAKSEMEKLNDEYPQDASIHHSLGLLYESLDDRPASLRHLARAVELEPGNEFYRSCLEATQSASQAHSGQP